MIPFLPLILDSKMPQADFYFTLPVSYFAFVILLQVSVWVSKFSAEGPAFNVILMLKVNLIHDLVSVYCTKL